MTQITINIEDPSIVPHLKKILSAINGVSIARPTLKTNKSGLDVAYEDIRAGRVHHAENADQLFKDVLGI